MESWRVFRERAEGGPKKQNAPALPRRNFLQEQVYHTITYCQEKFCKITKKLFTLLFSATWDGLESALELNDEEAKRLRLSMPQGAAAVIHVVACCEGINLWPSRRKKLSKTLLKSAVAKGTNSRKP